MKMQIEEADQKRALMVSSTFYPDPVVGAHRITQFAKHLCNLGWKIDVICRDYGHRFEGSELHRLHADNLNVHYVGTANSAPSTKRVTISSRRPRILNILSNKIREATIAAAKVAYYPDASARFWLSQCRNIETIARDRCPAVVFTTSPSHSLHHVGSHLAESLPCPWIADFRDPYLMVPSYRPRGLARLRWRSHLRFEHAVHQKATRTTFAIPMHFRWAKKRYPEFADKFVLIENGIPDELCREQASPPESKTEADSKQSERLIGIVGVVGPTALMQLCQAVRQLRARLPLRIIHAGRQPSNAAELSQSFAEEIDFLGLVPHDRAMRLVASSDILIKADDPARSKLYGVSSKLFEYLSTGRPLLLINGSLPDRALLRGKSWCHSLSNPTVSQIVDGLEAVVRHGPASEQRIQDIRQLYSRRRQAMQLAEVMDTIISTSKR